MQGLNEDRRTNPCASRTAREIQRVDGGRRLLPCDLVVELIRDRDVEEAVEQPAVIRQVFPYSIMGKDQEHPILGKSSFPGTVMEECENTHSSFNIGNRGYQGMSVSTKG
jgi:hypothetical protein